MIRIWLLLFLYCTGALAVCSSPISRTNNTANQVLTSTKYNLDLNTVYSKVNNLPGDCINDESISTDKIADEAITSAKLAPGLLAQFIPVGTILPYGGTVAPAGFLFCNGSAVSRTTYADLFEVTSTAFGSGNGSTTFNLPDFRGRFLRGVDGGAGRDPNAGTRTAMSTGGNSADNVGSVQEDALQNITGTFASGNPSVQSATGAFQYNSNSGDGRDTFGENRGVSFDASRVARTSTETRPKNANVNFIIKY